MSGHVLVFSSWKNCPHCIKFKGQWESVKTAVKKIYPTIRFFEVTYGELDFSQVPKGLEDFSREYGPMIILVPGQLWDSKPTDMKYGPSVFDASWNSDRTKIIPHQKLPRTPDAIARWIGTALSDPDFVRSSHQREAPTPTSIIREDSTASKSNKGICRMRIIRRQ